MSRSIYGRKKKEKKLKNYQLSKRTDPKIIDEFIDELSKHLINASLLNEPHHYICKSVNLKIKRIIFYYIFYVLIFFYI